MLLNRREPIDPLVVREGLVLGRDKTGDSRSTHLFQNLDAEMVYLSTLLSIAEMIKSGTTSFCDMSLFAGEVARAVDETGIRAWIGEVFYDFDSPSYGTIDNGFTMVEELFSTYRDHPLITITVDPSSM